MTGQYRYVRNPTYFAVLALVLGQALVFGSVVLLEYAAGLAILFHAFVHWYEEPNLSKQFGSPYTSYCRGVRRWAPRLTGWRGWSLVRSGAPPNKFIRPMFCQRVANSLQE